MKTAFTITISVKLDGSLYGRVEELKNCYANAETLKELFERIQNAIALALKIEDNEV